MTLRMIIELDPCIIFSLCISIVFFVNILMNLVENTAVKCRAECWKKIRVSCAEEASRNSPRMNNIDIANASP